jgi:hypothetical protein
MRALIVLILLVVSTLALAQSCTTYGDVTNCLSGDPPVDGTVARDRRAAGRLGGAASRDYGRSFQPFGSPPVVSNRTSCIRYGSVVRCD